MDSGRAGFGSVVVKICGITNLADAVDAIECGADALGFNLFPGSRRFINVETAAQWITDFPGAVRKVAVLVNPTIQEALTLGRCGLFDSLQLHGQESPEFCRLLAEHGIPFTKALPVRDENSLQQPIPFFTPNILLD